MALITKAAGVVWPGVPVVPVLEVGGTDGLLLPASSASTSTA